MSREVLKHYLQAHPLPWLSYDEFKGKFIMIVDNHLMSTYRSCPEHFVNAHVLGLRRKSSSTGSERVWFLEFGICLHEMLEKYYLNFRSPTFDMVRFCTKEAAATWAEHRMHEFSEEKECKSIGGLAGFIELLIQYTLVLSPENEKLRVLGTEVSFGRNLEVPLYVGPEIEIYLSGRMDVIVDDGYFICPMDHKSFASFRGDMTLKYATDEGPTGYVYALSSVLSSLLPPDLILKRDCSKILMNLISKARTADSKDRFKRIPVRKTAWQLEIYRQRMVATARRMFEDLHNLACSNERSTYRNTQVCQNWFNRNCQYFDICRQGSLDGEMATINNGFITVPLWDTEKVGGKKTNGTE